MPEQDPQYHPAVESVMETSGPDVGRIKYIPAAQDVAGFEDKVRAFRTNPEVTQTGADNVLVTDHIGPEGAADNDRLKAAAAREAEARRAVEEA